MRQATKVVTGENWAPLAKRERLPDEINAVRSMREVKVVSHGNDRPPWLIRRGATLPVCSGRCLHTERRPIE